MNSHPAQSDGWVPMRFGDIAEHVAERVEPNAEDCALYVGLEHLDSGSLAVSRWGSETKLIGTKLRMRKGDILFARRNAYLRRIAIAPHDGLFSAHGMILRAKRGAIEPDFLPFFMQSGHFMDRAEKISVGSLSPTINWSTLKTEVFALPPLAEQQRLVQVLRAADALKQSLEHLRSCTTHIEQALVDAAIEQDLDFKCTVAEAVERGVIEPPQDGNHGEKHPKAADYKQNGIPFLMAADITDGTINLRTCKFLSRTQADSLRIGFARPGDVLLTHKGTVGQWAIVPTLSTEYVMLTPQVTYYRVARPSELSNDYMAVVFRSSWFQSQLRAVSTGSTRAYIGITAQRKLNIACPPLHRQLFVVKAVHEVRQLRDRVQERLTRLSDLAAPFLAKCSLP